MLTQNRLIILTLFPCAALGLLACGGGTGETTRASTSTHDSATAATQADNTSIATAPSSVSPKKLVARVGPTAINYATVEHLMALGSAPEPLPDPPAYTGCIAAANAGEGAAQQADSQLKQGCVERYEHIRQSAISKAIHTQWLLGEAAEQGIRVSPADVQKEFAASKKSFKTKAEFDAYRKNAGLSVADMMSEIKLGKVADAIFKLITDKQHPATSAEVAAYYDAHQTQFGTPPGRTVRVFRTTTKASADKAKAEVEAGKSFAEVAKQLSAIGQPIGAKEGVVKDLLPGAYEEKSLNDAIFTAKLHRLYGPLQIYGGHKTIAPETNDGFFVYEVVGTVPGKQTPLAKVKGSIATALTKADKDKTLAGFIAEFRRKWTARTDCEPGFVVRNCKQFKGAKPASEDPYTL
jgi:hypothetical protein